MRTETKQDILSAGEIGARYDEAAKVLWKNREILAPLLKYAVKELADESVETIMKLIDADSIRDDLPVSDLPPTFTILNGEQSSTIEKPIVYDLRFNVRNPKLSSGKLLVMLHMDLEFQNKYNPTLRDGRSYPLIKRGVYYAAREISAQLGRITEKTNYADIEKVISIWVVNEDIPEELRNTASRYYLQKEDFAGTCEEPKEDYDLIEIIMIRRGEDRGLTEPLFRYLESVFSADINEIDKYTPASANEDIMREVKEMPGMSQVIYDRGIAQGITQGQNKLVEALERLHRGESREDLIASGVDEHTVDLAVSMRNTFLQESDMKLL